MRVAVVVMPLAFATGCIPSLPTPPTASHNENNADDVSVVVPYPPPPARVDLVLTRPAEMKSPVWVDGEWKWHGSRWMWEPGSWVDLEPNRVYAPPTLVYLSDGSLHWFAGAWRDKRTRAVVRSAE
jgi:hypothetical protein